MKKITLAAALATVAAYSGGATAASMEEEIEALKARLKQLEEKMQTQNEQMQAQEKAIEEKNAQIQELVENPRIRQMAERGEGWFENVEIGGVIEVEAGYEDPFEGSSTSDVVVATAELAVGAQVNDWVAGEITLLYEEDDTDLEVDVATITVANPDQPWFVTSGQFYVPFGTFETNLISDPLTLEIGETRESSIMGGVDVNGFVVAAYVFNGDNKKDGDDKIDNFGAVLGYSMEQDAFALSANVGYINDIGDSDVLQDVISDNLGSNDVDDHVDGFTVDVVFTTGPFTLIGEYTRATDNFQVTEVPFKGSGAEPEAFNIEAGYGFTLFGKDATFALAYQGTDEALALELPEERILAGLSVDILENTSLALEYARDDDYSRSDGGTGNSADIVTTQLAVEF